eukprot:COSAG06_NODE_14643_length_1139_cov_1.369231_1_plen_168_part_10
MAMFYTEKRSIYQDRLGTNISQVETKGVFSADLADSDDSGGSGGGGRYGGGRGRGGNITQQRGSGVRPSRTIPSTGPGGGHPIGPGPHRQQQQQQQQYGPGGGGGGGRVSTPIDDTDGDVIQQQRPLRQSTITIVWPACSAACLAAWLPACLPACLSLCSRRLPSTDT